VQTAESYMLVVIEKVCGHVEPLVLLATTFRLFLLGAKRITIINVVHILNNVV